MQPGHFHIAQFGPGPVGHGPPVAGQIERIGAHGPRAPVGVGKNAVRRTRAQTYGFGPVHIGLVFAGIYGEHARCAPLIIQKQLIAHGAVVNLHPPLSGLLCQYRFLIDAVVLQEGASPARYRVPGEVISAVMLHGNAPLVPQAHDVPGFHEERLRPFRPHLAQPIAVLKLHDIADEGGVIPVDLGDVADEMIIAQAAAAAAPGIRLLQNHAVHALLGGVYGRHESGYAPAHAEEVRIPPFHAEFLRFHRLNSPGSTWRRTFPAPPSARR